MGDTIDYLNTDLDLISASDLSALAAAFKARRGSPNLRRGDDGLWYATIEVYTQPYQPESHISTMLAMVESLDEPMRAVWSGCTLREFNIGYDCGNEPWAFNQGLSNPLLGRIAAAGASLRITLYPPSREKPA